MASNRFRVDITCDLAARHKDRSPTVVDCWSFLPFPWVHTGRPAWVNKSPRTTRAVILKGNDPGGGFTPHGTVLDVGGERHAGRRATYDWTCHACPTPKSTVTITSDELLKLLEGARATGMSELPLTLIERSLTTRHPAKDSQ